MRHDEATKAGRLMKRNSSKFRRRLQSGQYKRRRRRRREAEGGKERRENNESHQWPIVDRFKYRMLSRVHSQSVSQSADDDDHRIG